MSRQWRTSRAMLLLAAVSLAAACADTPTSPAPAGSSFAPRAATYATRAGYIRIGVVPSDTAILIGGTDAFVVTDKVTGATLTTGSNTQVRVTQTAASTVTYYRLQVMCGSVSARDTRVALAQSKGYVTYTAWNATAGCWRVYLGQFDPGASYSVRNAFRNKAIADGVSGTDSFWSQVTQGTPAQLKVTNGGAVVQTPNAVVVTPTAGLLKIAGILYRGTGEVAVNSPTSGLKLAGINELPLEQYLYGVVPKELSPGQYPEMEAIKAQAIAARTYAIAGLGKRGADGYDLLATTSDQVYGGYSAEQAMSNQAVDETAGLVLTYQGNLIGALYHSTSGGWTANNEDVYTGATPVAYLRGIPDQERGQALEHVPSLDVFRNHASAKSLRSAHESDFESNWARFHRWSYEWGADELRTVLSAYFKVDVGVVSEVNVVSRSESGRIEEIRFVCENGTFVEYRDRIRGALQFVDADKVRKNLPSTLFYIEPVLDPRTKAIEGFQAWGGGFGHGLGMAQTGAVGMAQKGATYEEILKHYYRGVEIVQR